jgi:hypothetical protein
MKIRAWKSIQEVHILVVHSLGLFLGELTELTQYNMEPNIKRHLAIHATESANLPRTSGSK